jgi:ABC-2 type transport system permease protein
MPDLEDFLANFPEVMKEIFPLETITTGKGFLNAELFSVLLPVVFLIFGISRGAAMIAGEEETGTIELLLVTPASRSRVAAEKAAALVAATLALGLIVFFFVWSSGLIVDAQLPMGEVAAGVLALVLLGTEHGLVAMAVGLLTGQKTWALAVGSTLAVAGYVLHVAGQLVDSVEPYQTLSPVHQALGAGPVGGLSIAFLWMTLVGIVVFAVSLPRFEHRDIAT